MNFFKGVFSKVRTQAYTGIGYDFSMPLNTLPET